MNNTLKKLAIGALSLSIALTTVACGNPKYKPVKPDKDSTKIVQDKNYTENLKKEDIVLDGQVYLQNGSVMGVIVIKEDAKKEDAKKLMDEYAKEIKKTYKDMPVNVQAVQNGENLGMVTLD